jgi:hypothetical protein
MRTLVSLFALCGLSSVVHADDVTDDLVAAAPRGRAPGVRVAPDVAVVVPLGDLVDISGMQGFSYGTSVAPGARVGYEVFAGDVGVELGALARFTLWQLPSQIADTAEHWTLETHLYGRAAYHVGRIAPFAAVSIGLDTNHTEYMKSQTTSVGLGINLSAGVAVAITKLAAVEAAVDFHPGTDSIDGGDNASVSYLAFRLAATLRL